METYTIFLILFVILCIYVIYKYISKDVNTLSAGMLDATAMSIFPMNYGAPGTAAPANFSYSVWFYIEDWSYNYGKEKVILARLGDSSQISGDSCPTTLDGFKLSQPCPLITLDANSNNVNILMQCAGGNVSQTTVTDIPIQKWVNLLVSVYGTTLDVYIDGKLVITTILPGIVQINAASSMYLTPCGGFAGWTAKLQYFPNSTDPQTAWDNYSKGYGASWLSNVFGKYQVKLALMSGNTEAGSIQI